MRGSTLLLLGLGCLTGCVGYGALDSGEVAETAPPPPDSKPSPGGGGCEGYTVASLRGYVFDEAGLGRPGVKAQLCIREGTSDRLTCLRPVDTDAQGAFFISVPDDTRCMGVAALRILAPGEAAATSYCHLDLSTGPDVVLPSPLTLFATRTPASRPEADPLDRTAHPVDFGDGLEVDIAPGRLYGGSYDQLSARRIDPTTPGLCFPEEIRAFDGLFAFAPEADVEGPGLAMRIATSEPPLTAVALYVLGGQGCTDANGDLIPEAGWLDFGTGIVGDDGYIHVGAEGGLPCLSWFGYRVIRRGEDRAPPPPGAVPPADERPPPPDPPLGGGDAPDPTPPPADPTPPDPTPPEPPEDEEDPPPAVPPVDPPTDPPADPPTDPPPGDCVYPPAGGGISLGGTMPVVEWPDAVDGAGNRVGFSLRDFHCDPAYERYSIVAFVVSTGWCSACPDYLRDVASQAQAIERAGGLVVIEESEDGGYSPIDSAGAARFLSRYIGNMPGLRVGGGSSQPTVQLIARSNIVQAYPAAFVVRRRDMRVISELRSAPGGMPIAQIAADPDRNWGAGADQAPQCGPADEEPSEPNNASNQAAALAVGQTVDGGVCGADMDFYRINHNGPWTLDLRFRHSDGDLDVYVWDTARNQPLQQGGRPVGGESGDDDERFSWQGPATIGIIGYQGATSPYRLSLAGQ